MTAAQFITAIGSFLGIFVLILDGKTALLAATEGITLCIQTVIPALFPFFICTSLLMSYTLGTKIRLLQPIGRIFSLPQAAETLLVPAILGGYPVGAQCVADAWKNDRVTKENAERMLSFCSNAGPSFLFGIIGQMFPDKHIPWLLWIIHILSAWMVSRIYSSQQQHIKMNSITPSPGQVMTSAVKTTAIVCGWIILFRVIIGFLDRWFLWLLPQNARVLVIGILELANGCSELHTVSDPYIRFLICSVILSLGGICVTLQTMSVTRGLSLKYYCRGKGLQCLFSILLSIGILRKIWILPIGLILYFCYFSGKTKNTGGNPKKAVV